MYLEHFVHAGATLGAENQPSELQVKRSDISRHRLSQANEAIAGKIVADEGAAGGMTH